MYLQLAHTVALRPLCMTFSADHIVGSRLGKEVLKQLLWPKVVHYLTFMKMMVRSEGDPHFVDWTKNTFASQGTVNPDTICSVKVQATSWAAIEPEMSRGVSEVLYSGVVSCCLAALLAAAWRTACRSRLCFCSPPSSQKF